MKTKIVARDTNGQSIVDLTDCFDIKIGEGMKAVVINLRDSWIEVRTPEGTLTVQPISSNSIYVSASGLFLR